MVFGFKTTEWDSKMRRVLMILSRISSAPGLAAVEAVIYIQHQYKVDFVEAILPQHQVKTGTKLVGFNFFEKAVRPQH